jgi:hypothetical protein
LAEIDTTYERVAKSEQKDAGMPLCWTGGGVPERLALKPCREKGRMQMEDFNLFRVLQIIYYVFVIVCGTVKAMRRRIGKKDD